MFKWGCSGVVWFKWGCSGVVWFKVLKGVVVLKIYICRVMVVLK